MIKLIIIKNVLKSNSHDKLKNPRIAKLDIIIEKAIKNQDF